MLIELALMLLSRQKLTSSGSLRSGSIRMELVHLFRQHYLPNVPDISDTTVKKIRSHCRRWKMATECGRSSQITEQTFVEFRRHCVRRGLSPRTCESIIADIQTLLRCAQKQGLIESVPDVGRKLKCPAADQQPADLTVLGRVYQNVHCARWCPKYRSATWRLWIVSAYTLGLRLGDLQSLTWGQVKSNCVQVKAAKTGKLQRFPIHPVLRRHLNEMPQNGERVFWTMSLGVTRKVRRTLRELCEELEVDYFTPQMIRRLAGREYEKAHGGAGRILLGHGLGSSSSFYLSEFEILETACQKIRIPDEFLSDEEREDKRDQLRELIDVCQRLDESKREALATVARSMT